MFKKFIGRITIAVVRFYSTTRIAKWIAKRRAAKIEKSAGDVMDDLITELRAELSRIVLREGVYAEMRDADLKAEHDLKSARLIRLIEIQQQLKHQKSQ